MEDTLPLPEFFKELIDPELSHLAAYQPKKIGIFLHQQRHRLNLLVKEGFIIVKEECSLYVNDRGFIAATGCPPLPKERLMKPAPDVIPILFNRGNFISAMGCRSLTAEEPREPAPVMISGPVKKDKAESRESPLAARIMEDLTNAPPLRCLIWKTILKTLNEMRSRQRTAETLVALLKPAIEEEEKHWGTLITMRESLDIDLIVEINFHDVWATIYALAKAR
jgi:hypothetical protein